MPTYTYSGNKCDQIHEVQRPLAEFAEVISCPCERKGCKAELTLLPRWMNARVQNQQLSGTVYFENARGHIIPAGSDSDSAPQGYERKEASTLNEMRSLEKRLTQAECRKRQEFVEREQQQFEQTVRENRRELRSAMEQMSEKGKAFAREAMRRNDTRKMSWDKRVDPGVNLYVLNYDQKRS